MSTAHLDPRTERRLGHIVERIDARLDGTGSDLSLATGLAGVAGFYCELRRHFPSLVSGARLDALVANIHEGVGRAQVLHFSLHAGLPGTALALEHIAARSGVSLSDLCALNEDIDELVLDHLHAAGPGRNHDLVYGLAGLGVYASSRADRRAGQAIFSRVFQQLMACSESDADGRYWVSRKPFISAAMQAQYPHGYCDLGLAHGNPGVLAMLAQARLDGLQAPHLDRAIDDLARWILNAARPDTPSAFESALGDGKDARSAWCYGDPGVALSILRSGSALDSRELLVAGAALGLRAARRDDSTTRVKDHQICHGSAGLALMFARMFRACGHPDLQKAAQRWQGRILSDGVFWDSLHDTGPDGRRQTLGLLQGLAGIGMALLPDQDGDHGRWSAFLCI